MMMRVCRPVLVTMLALSVSGCAMLNGRSAATAPAAEPGLATEFAAPVETTSLESMGAGQSVAALDQTSDAEKKAALAAPAAGGVLGRQVVALGSPADPGLWVQTSLVTAVTKGSVTAPGGQTLAVELRPGTGAALMSLAAYQALGIGLTELPEMAISGG
ncbi:MAG: hypothetical protein R3D63_07535 [Paracoccaceae bacterium]